MRLQIASRFYIFAMQHFFILTQIGIIVYAISQCKVFSVASNLSSPQFAVLYLNCELKVRTDAEVRTL
jgi:hypothetical protein